MKQDLTINEAISFMNQLNSRIAELKELRTACSVKETRFFGDQSQTVKEPQYDIKRVDKKIVELQNHKYRIESKIKAVNASTKLGVEIDVEELLAPLV